MLLEKLDVFSLCAVVESAIPTNTSPELPANHSQQPPHRAENHLVCRLYRVTKLMEFLILETHNKNPDHKELPIILIQLGFFNPTDKQPPPSTHTFNPF
jgi:hypothetical protein